MELVLPEKSFSGAVYKTIGQWQTMQSKGLPLTREGSFSRIMKKNQSGMEQGATVHPSACDREKKKGQFSVRVGR